MVQMSFALDETDREVQVSKAVRNSPYKCPECKAPVNFRRGDINAHHFYHLTSPPYCAFEYENETEEHYRAKMSIVERVNQGRSLWFLRECQALRHVYSYSHKGIAKADTEFTLKSGHRADVALFDEDGNLALVVEVLVHHRVDDLKAAALKEHGFPWVEIEAATILDDQSVEWHLTQEALPPHPCAECEGLHRQAIDFIVQAFQEKRPIQFDRKCRDCKRHKFQPLPSDIKKIVPDLQLSHHLQTDVAFLGESGETRAVVQVLVGAQKVQEEKAMDLNKTGLPWISVGHTDVLRTISDYILRPVEDHFRTFQCKHCKEREKWQAEKLEREQRQREQQESHREIVNRYRSTYQFKGATREWVTCPVPNAGDVSIVERCSACRFLLDFASTGVTCFGSSYGTQR